eukprot:CAMPEP_0183745996 /NCGR_PEP_ID=MMETSP0737-20130205/66526_1 /TAXON_ID=385413 /ORGANISM="Thalassiosira miniscula, Strain CCMP1093" /LENGTH=529 /DNA_ID=CAMNT_0025981675 /DNA_START=13 /DNA_END=1603 /DNA_ORIENTATION=-
MSSSSSSSSSKTTITIYLSLTSSPSTPRISLTLPNSAKDNHTHVDSSANTNAAELRRRISLLTTVPLETLKLIYRGRVIANKEEGDVVKDYRLEDGCVVHVMGKPVGDVGGTGAGAGSGTASSTGGAAAAPSAAGASVTLPTAAAPSSSTAASSSSPLSLALTKLRTSNDGPTYRTALTTADKLLGNIVSHPMEEKYRTIKKANPAFSKRLGSLPGGSDLLLSAGFTLQTKDDLEYYILTPSADAWPQLVTAREEVQKLKMQEERSAAAAPTQPPNAGGMPNLFPPMGNAGGAGAADAAAAPTQPPNAGGMPNLFPPMGNAGGAGAAGAAGVGVDGNQMAMMQSLMNDPNMMQNAIGMMNNPMVQNMMRNDPRFANNPMLQQSLQQLQNNPEMVNQMMGMMNDPNVRNQMMSMMSQGGGGGLGGAGGSAGGAANDPFAGGPEAMRRQMEQFQRMTQQFGGSSGSFPAATGGGSSAGGGGAAGGATNGTGSGSATNANASGAGGSAGNNDNEMTEEEMIAEAIARSLRES